MGHKDGHHNEKRHHKEDKKKRQMSKETESKEQKKAWDVGEKECRAPDYHKMHMCVLKHMGQMQLFDQLSNNPTHRCSRCGCTSNNPKNLCQPYEL